MFYLTTHSTHLIYDYSVGRMIGTGNVLFNDALDTFDIQL